jgi:hypothetical protein
MTDMKRRATALLDFISRTQVELAGETAPSPADSKGEDSKEAKVNGDASASLAAAQQDGRSAKPQPNGVLSTSKEFTELSCMEMMDSLTRRLVKWQQVYTP